MPSLHCPFPPDEEEKTPEEEVIDLGEVAAPNENEDVEIDANADITRSEEEEDDSMADIIHEIYDTSSEASSISNDLLIHQFLPEICSSDDDESEGGGFWTPPSSISDEFEQFEVSTTGRQDFQQLGRNTARRSRVRRPGVFYMRREQHREPVSQQDLNRLSPFENDLTFNGFDRNLEPEEVTGHTIDHSREILYKVKWKTVREAKLIESSVMRAYRPEMIMDYFEKVVKNSYQL